MEVLLFDKAKHRTLGQLVERALTDQSLPAMIDTKEEIEDDAYDGYEEYHQRPCHRLGWLPVVHDDVDNGRSDNNPRQCDTYYI